MCIVGLMASCNDDDGQKVEPIVYPIFSAASGNFNNAFAVEISSNVDGAKIYYTTDGSLPSTSSTAYSAPIQVSGDMEIKAIAVGAGRSEIGGVNYNLVTDAPDLSVAPGNIEFSQYVKLSSSTEGASIYYTLDGSEPTMDSDLFVPSEDSIWVSAETDTIRAIAYKENFAPSEVLKAKYSLVLSELGLIYWYAADDAVPSGGTTTFLPYDAIINENYDVTLNSSTLLTSAPIGFDVMVMADNNSGSFSLEDFQGRIIVTFDSGVEGLLNDLLGETALNPLDYWGYDSEATITWNNPAEWGTEPVSVGDAIVISNDLENIDDEDISFVKREDIIQGKSGGDPTSDAVIVYEIKKGDKQWYWVHIGPIDSNYSFRASEVLDYTLEKLRGI